MEGLAVLILSRKSQQAVVVGAADGVEQLLKITVLEIYGGNVKLGFEAEANIPVHRWEVWERIRAGFQPDRPARSPPEVSCSKEKRPGP
jgi:carbon storage regulator CsrA